MEEDLGVKLFSKRKALIASAALGLAVSGLVSYAAAAKTTPKFGHVWVIVMENKGFVETFGPATQAPYFGKTLPKMGQLLTNYYGTGHLSLDNYIAMVSGQAANVVTQSDCILRPDFVPALPVTDGQFLGQGCVYPKTVPTVVDQLEAKKVSWHAYMEDMGKDPARAPKTCGVPKTDAIGRDLTQSATAKDQYAGRHNPFVYFRSVMDEPSCHTNITELATMKKDLASIKTTASFNFITPDLCSDGHDAPCIDGRPGGLKSEDAFLKEWIPRIMASPAYKKDGLILITYDEAEVGDSAACCTFKLTPNTPMAGINGLGGGRVGAVLLSPKLKPGSIDNTSYDHFSLLRSIEDNWGVSHLGFAAKATSFKY